MLPNIPKALPRSAPRKYCWIMPMPCGLSRPEPMPCTKRATVRVVGSPAIPAATEATVNTTTPAMNMNPRPKMSPARPAATSTTPKVNA